MVKKYLTISEMSKQTDIPDSTCRRYLDEFKDFFVEQGGSRVKKYEEDAVVILSRIRTLYHEGLDKDAIHNILASEFPVVIDGGERGEDDDEEEKTPTVPTMAIAEDIVGIKQALEEQKKFNKMLLQELMKMQRYIEDSVERRDRELMQLIREKFEEKQQSKLEAAEAEKEKERKKEEEKKKGIFRRLFSRM